MVRELLVSVVSGIIVALISGLFTRRSSGGGAQSGSGSGKVFVAFLLGAAVVFVLLTFGHGRFGFH